MKKVILSTVAIAALLALGGCAEKKSCNTKKVTPVVKKAPAAPKPAPVVKAPVVQAPAILVEEAPAIIEEPMIDPKEASVR
jgi:hypothetical protein